MKNFYLLCCILATILALSSCASVSNVDKAESEALTVITGDNNIDQNSTSVAQNVESGEPSQFETEKEYIDIQLVTFVSLDEFEKFLIEKKINQNFINYGKISDMGEFVSFVFISDALSEDYSRGFYTLKNADGLEFGLYVEPVDRTNISSLKQIFSVQSSTDMRTLGTEESGVYSLDGIEYIYVSGVLSSIIWESDDVMFTVLLDSNITNLQIDEMSGCLSQLLNAQTACQYVNDFEAKMSVSN